jgi:hypothetical protein
VNEPPATTSTGTASSTAQPSGGGHAHRISDPVVIQKEPLHEVLYQCFRHLYNLDVSNAAMHFAYVRFSPLTFRTAEHLWQFEGLRHIPELRQVILDLGEYEEDPGR